MTQMPTFELDMNDTKVIVENWIYVKALILNDLKDGTKAAMTKVTFNDK